MKNAQLAQLGISPRSEDELHEALSRFEAKWERKFSRL
ncbi:MAG: hypothetical protein QG629_700 [Patescibacteria group bacterium]|nr:hypothetical protein [Patescibacteria group bacterium]